MSETSEMMSEPSSWGVIQKIGQDVLNLQDVTFTRHSLNMAADKVESLIVEVLKKNQKKPPPFDRRIFLSGDIIKTESKPRASISSLSIKYQQDQHACWHSWIAQRMLGFHCFAQQYQPPST